VVSYSDVHSGLFAGNRGRLHFPSGNGSAGTVRCSTFVWRNCSGGNHVESARTVGNTMATKTKSKKQDRPRVSSQRHEIEYTAGKVAGRGGNKRKARAAVKSAKKGMGRKTSRRAVMRRAKAAM
jgi:phage protein D